MILLADESVDFGIVNSLRQNNIEVFFISEFSAGVNDTKVLNIANSKNCLLITEDKDFGELAYRLKLEHHGILLIRLSDLPRTERLIYATETIVKYYDELQNCFSVLTQRGLRIKPSTK